MIFVWGSSGEKKELSEGEFFCPECELVCAFTMSQDVEKLHVYGIPINEEKKSDEYVVCKTCESAYKPSVLALDETGVANEHSRFLPLSQHESLKDLYETCQGYEKAISPGSLGCSLLLLSACLRGPRSLMLIVRRMRILRTKLIWKITQSISQIKCMAAGGVTFWNINTKVIL